VLPASVLECRGVCARVRGDPPLHNPSPPPHIHTRHHHHDTTSTRQPRTNGPAAGGDAAERVLRDGYPPALLRHQLLLDLQLCRFVCVCVCVFVYGCEVWPWGWCPQSTRPTSRRHVAFVSVPTKFKETGHGMYMYCSSQASICVYAPPPPAKAGGPPPCAAAPSRTAAAPVVHINITSKRQQISHNTDVNDQQQKQTQSCWGTVRSPFPPSLHSCTSQQPKPKPKRAFVR
jgi:hypothetical protein